MRYENQNPQYIYLLEKIEEQERTIKLLKERIKSDDAALKKLDERFAQIIDFNVLPWYKKMFYKFKV
ncbi:MAG: hypothetical protein U0M06_02685 [Clostridia bacterium]|nr:hypothetical protein [Clostridia bacterium]